MVGTQASWELERGGGHRSNNRSSLQGYGPEVASFFQTATCVHKRTFFLKYSKTNLKWNKNKLEADAASPEVPACSF